MYLITTTFNGLKLKALLRPHLLNLLNYKLFTLRNKKYIKYIQRLINSEEFKKQVNEENIQISYLDKFIESKHRNELFSLNKEGEVNFLHCENMIKFIFDKKKLTAKTRIVLNVNIKNQQCYELISILIQLQEKFILSNNKQDLKYISHQDILDYHKKHYDTSLVSSNISTISHNTFYRDSHNNVYKLNYLIPKWHFILYLKCRYVLNENITMTDKELSANLKEVFNLDVSKTKIYQIRKRYLIPNKNHRVDDIYLDYEKNYSDIRLLCYKNIKDFHLKTGVYELLNFQEYKYNYKKSKTIYIGSSNDLKRRLTTYVSGFAHTSRIMDYLDDNVVYFRVIENENYKNLERDVLEAFFSTYGEYPYLNTNRVL